MSCQVNIRDPAKKAIGVRLVENVEEFIDFNIRPSVFLTTCTCRVIYVVLDVVEDCCVSF